LNLCCASPLVRQTNTTGPPPFGLLAGSISAGAAVKVLAVGAGAAGDVVVDVTSDAQALVVPGVSLLQAARSSRAQGRLSSVLASRTRTFVVAVVNIFASHTLTRREPSGSRLRYPKHAQDGVGDQLGSEVVCGVGHYRPPARECRRETSRAIDACESRRLCSICSITSWRKSAGQLMGLASGVAAAVSTTTGSAVTRWPHATAPETCSGPLPRGLP